VKYLIIGLFAALCWRVRRSKGLSRLPLPQSRPEPRL